MIVEGNKYLISCVSTQRIIKECALSGSVLIDGAISMFHDKDDNVTTRARGGQEETPSAKRTITSKNLPGVKKKPTQISGDLPKVSPSRMRLC